VFIFTNKEGSKIKYCGVIFDLDGVIVKTDEYHYQAWKELAEREKIPFDRMVNERLRGVSRMESLEIVLERACKTYSQEQKRFMASEKNEIYRCLLEELSKDDILPGVISLLNKLKEQGLKTAIASSSRNASFIIQKIGIGEWFDTVVDGEQIINSKPDPEVFQLAAKFLNLPVQHCIVVEDAVAGIDAAVAAGAKAVAVGPAAGYEKADYAVLDLSYVDIDRFLFRGEKVHE